MTGKRCSQIDNRIVVQIVGNMTSGGVRGKEPRHISRKNIKNGSGKVREGRRKRKMSGKIADKHGRKVTGWTAGSFVRGRVAPER